MPDDSSDRELFIVPATQVWTETGIHLRAGQTVHLAARGEIVALPASRSTAGVPAKIPPEGTYLFDDRDADRDFPLPAAAGGPAPCYGLIARIGDGEPFFVGRGRSFQAPHGGPLRLGINDFDVSDNSGEFLVEIDFHDAHRPVMHERVLHAPAAQRGQPAADCSVVVFYVDGLRPDVVREMVALGHLPNIRRHFVENGAWLENTFTAFPSDTITSNGTMWTGCFSDRHGLKGQVNFSRRRLTSESFLDPFGPQRSAQWLSPGGADRLVQASQAAAIGLVRGTAAREAWLDVRQSSVPPLYDYLRQHGQDWAVGVLPVMTEVPPPLWSRSLARYMPYFQSQKAWEYMDEANADYAIRNLLTRRQPVTILWLPETDTCSHKCSRGQFGMTRRTIARVDQLLAAVVDELDAQGRLDKTYLLLVSDHGHVGGRDAHLSNFDLATDFWFRPRVLDQRGDWVGGGLGLSVRMHRHHNQHQEDSAREFVFIDGDSDGVARIFLPKGHYRSKDWSGPNRPGDLLRYRVDPNREPVDLPPSLASIHAVNSDGALDRPVDLVLLKLTDTSLLITTADRGQAVIERRRAVDGRWEYRYLTVIDVQPSGDGEVTYQPHPDPRTDPLELLFLVPSALLAEFHDEQFWLELTCRTAYPDAVVALTRHMLWDDGLVSCEREFAPDLVVTARPNWYFGTSASPGTMHGYPLAEAARATWFVAGPNVRRGTRITVPARLTDLTPTILDMIGLWDRVATQPTTFDGQPRREIYSHPVEYVTAPSPVYWSDVDLQAWRRLNYTPLKQSGLLPRSIHQPETPLDLNNIVYSLAILPDLSVFRIMDDVISPLSGGRQPVTSMVDGAEAFLRKRPNPILSFGARVPDVPNVALADYSMTSQGNLQRMDRAIDWIQNCGSVVEQQIAAPFHRKSLPLTRPLHQTVDTVQYGFWEVYRFGQRSGIRLIDEGLLNTVEDGTGRLLNALRPVPNEITLPSEIDFEPNL